jgi:hypothetical protein
MRSLAQMVLTAFAIGLALGAGVTRTARHLSAAHAYLFGGEEPAWIAASGEPSAEPADEPGADPSAGAAGRPVPLPLHTEAAGGGGSFLILEEAGALPRFGTVDWGLCRSSQKQTLDSDGFEQYGDGGNPLAQSVVGNPGGDPDDEDDGDDNVKERSGGQMGLPGCAAKGANATVLIVSPMHNRAHQSKGEMAMDRYFRLLSQLDYPKELISLAVLEGDSTDNTYAELQKSMARLKGQGYRRLMLLQKDWGYVVPGGKEERHRHIHQLGRRAHLARLRNHLVVTALRDEEWVLWLDADLWSYPPDIIQQLQSAGKDFVVPHCVVDKGQTFDLNSWQETEASLQLQDGMHGDEVLFEGCVTRLLACSDRLAIGLLCPPALLSCSACLAAPDLRVAWRVCCLTRYARDRTASLPPWLAGCINQLRGAADTSKAHVGATKGSSGARWQNGVMI